MKLTDAYNIVRAALDREDDVYDQSCYEALDVLHQAAHDVQAAYERGHDDGYRLSAELVDQLRAELEAMKARARKYATSKLEDDWVVGAAQHILGAEEGES